jgi:hypothetical protein
MAEKLEKKAPVSGLTPDQLEPWNVRARIEILLGQADTLERLKRPEDRERKLKWGMVVTRDCQEAHPDSPIASFYAAKIARAAGQLEFASQLLNLARKLDHDRILGSSIGYEENLLQLERAVVDTSLPPLGQRLLVYVCQRCGRPIEYISIPCVYCGWQPTSPVEMSLSARLSRIYFNTWELLGIGRGIVAGRKATEVVVNLAEHAAEQMANPQSEFRKDIESVLHSAQQKKKDNYFSWHEAATCKRCRTFNFRQNLNECMKCGEPLRLPPPLRLLICLARLAIHLQHNFAGPESGECDVFIRYVISLQSKLYRQQETPSNSERAKVIELMTKIGKFWTNGEYGEISMGDPEHVSYTLGNNLMSEEAKAKETTALEDFTETLQFLANWMKLTRTLA